MESSSPGRRRASPRSPSAAALSPTLPPTTLPPPVEDSPAGSPARAPRRVPVNSGNPRITVAFPFSTIKISQPDPQLAVLAGLLHRLAVHTAVLARELDTDEAEELEALVEDVEALTAGLADD
jgi:hypothetical protein